MIDLHIHSTHSDGTLTPTELIRLAEKTGLSAAALCDHNNIGGLPEFLSAAEHSSVEAIGGVEFSTDYGDTELHILGLWIRPQHYGTVEAFLQEALERKEESNCALIHALAQAGCPMDYRQIKANTPGGIVNRAVIAAEMTRLGYTASVEDAFSRWLDPRHGYFQPPRRPDTFAVIRFLRSIGAVSVLAHPFLNLKTTDSLAVFLEKAVSAGLDGMETRYPKFDDAQTQLAQEAAAAFGLLESGGSDFHGANKPEIRMGTGKGSLLVPDAFLDKLTERAAQNAAAS